MLVSTTKMASKVVPLTLLPHVSACLARVLLGIARIIGVGEAGGIGVPCPLTSTIYSLDGVGLGRISCLRGPAIPPWPLELAWEWRAVTEVESACRLAIIPSRYGPVSSCSSS